MPHSTRHLFFTGKGGVGKTSLSTAVALRLADSGKRVRLVRTDAASNLDEMLGVVLSNQATPVPGAPGLSVLNIDPGTIAGLRVDRIDSIVETQRYVDKIIASKGAALDTQVRALLREGLKSRCTEEVAVFHAFSKVVSEARGAFVVLDTAPSTSRSARPQ